MRNRPALHRRAAPLGQRRRAAACCSWRAVRG